MRIKQFFAKNWVLAVVFLTGASVLIIEVTALRILSPFFGNTIYTATSVISVILGALSVGYYVGGKVADRFPQARLFSLLVFISGLLVLLIQVLSKTILTNEISVMPITTGPLIGSIVLFFIPGVLLGMLSPFAVRLHQQSNSSQGVGSIAGGVFFWSTTGSIFGSVLAGFYLIPNLGVDRIVLMVASLLLVLGGLPLIVGLQLRKATLVLFVTVATWCAATVVTAGSVGNGIVYRSDGRYDQITIVDGEMNSRPVRLLWQDKALSGGMYLDGEDHLFDYTQYYELHKLLPRPPEKILVVGGGGNVITRAFANDVPGAEVSVFEIEPELFLLSQEYFGLSDVINQVNSYVGDGRYLLREGSGNYDVIYIDAMRTVFSVPSNLTTQEFFQLVDSKLSKEAIVIVNIIGSYSGSSPSLALSVIKTFNSVFNESLVIAAKSNDLNEVQNIILIGFKSISSAGLDTSVLTTEYMRTMTERLVDVANYNLENEILLTDNYAPVDYLSAQHIREAL